MRPAVHLSAIAAIALASACSSNPDAPDAGAQPDASTADGGGAADAGPADGGAREVTLSFDFEQDAAGWTAGFADLPENPNESFELDSGLRQLPSPLPARQGFLLQSHNRSDDVWMYLARRLTAADGLVAGQRYEAAFAIDLATNAPEGCMGIGGAPAEAVKIKAGASPRPAEIRNEGGTLRFTLDLGDQSEGGADATVIGNASSGLACPDKTYVLVQRSGSHTARASDAGELTVFVGSDSGYEGLTALYYDRIALTLRPVAER